MRPILSREWCAYLRAMMLWSVAGTGAILASKFARGALGGAAPVGAWWHPAGWWLVPFLGYAAVNVAVGSPVGWLGWWDWLGWAQRVITFWLALDVVRLPGPRWILPLGIAE